MGDEWWGVFAVGVCGGGWVVGDEWCKWSVTNHTPLHITIPHQITSH